MDEMHYKPAGGMWQPVPDDVRVTALEAAEGHPQLAPNIATAILDERERCAKLADSLKMCSHEYDEDVGDAIRLGAAFKPFYP